MLDNYRRIEQHLAKLQFESWLQRWIRNFFRIYSQVSSHRLREQRTNLTLSPIQLFLSYLLQGRRDFFYLTISLITNSSFWIFFLVAPLCKRDGQGGGGSGILLSTKYCVGARETPAFTLGLDTSVGNWDLLLGKARDYLQQPILAAVEPENNLC